MSERQPRVIGLTTAALIVVVLAGIGVAVRLALTADGDGDDDAGGGSGNGGAGPSEVVGSEPPPTVGEPANLDESIERALSDSAARRPCGDFDRVPEIIEAAERYALDPIGSFDQPTWVAVHPITGWSVVVERAGRLVDLDSGEVLVDLTDRTRAEHDGGALTAVFDSTGEWIYLYRSSNDDDVKMTTTVTAHMVDDAGRSIEGDGSTIITVEQPSPQHDGGGLAWGPDDKLWVALGDGGGLGDPWPNAQDPSTLLGSILRLDPTPAEGGYTVPDDNPFVGQPEARPEVWSIGLRNPFRLSFDSRTGTLFVADAGQSCWEELNVVSNVDENNGLNFGWDLFEGFEPFQTPPVKPEIEPELADPAVSYRHGAGRCATSGGFVYYGEAMAERFGQFLWTDYCGTDVWALSQDSDGVWSMVEMGLETTRPVAVVADAEGEPLVISAFEDAAEQTGGAIYRIVPA